MISPTALTALADMIDALDDPAFPDAVARFGRTIVDHDAFTFMRHNRECEPHLIYGSMGAISNACDRYSQRTYLNDPFVIALRYGTIDCVYRLGDLAHSYRANPPLFRGDIVITDEEESGYRTIGWPRRLEEIGLVIPASADTHFQLAFYRPRVGDRVGFDQDDVMRLKSVYRPLQAIFRRHPVWAGLQVDNQVNDALTVLTRREREVFELIMTGYGSKAISRRLGIGLVTVKTHRKNLYRKLGVASLNELFAMFAGRQRARAVTRERSLD